MFTVWWTLRLDWASGLRSSYWDFVNPKTVVPQVLATSIGVNIVDVGICEIGPNTSFVEEIGALKGCPEKIEEALLLW